MVSFAYKKQFSSLLGEIYRPVAEVSFRDKNGSEIVSFMFVDSGADITLISKSFGESLGLEINKEEIKEVRGIGDSRVPVIIKKLPLKIGDISFEARVAWALVEGVPPLLGRIDVFDRFEVSFKQKEKITEFKED